MFQTKRKSFTKNFTNHRLDIAQLFQVSKLIKLEHFGSICDLYVFIRIAHIHIHIYTLYEIYINRYI